MRRPDLSQSFAKPPLASITSSNGFIDSKHGVQHELEESLVCQAKVNGIGSSNR
jgi:hypothetical protein